MSRTNFGEVRLELGEKEYVLLANINAYDKIETMTQGLRKAIEMCEEVNVGLMAYVVMAGADCEKKDLQKIRGEILQEGVLKVMPKIVDYLSIFLNPAGRDQSEVEESSGEQ